MFYGSHLSFNIYNGSVLGRKDFIIDSIIWQLMVSESPYEHGKSIPFLHPYKPVITHNFGHGEHKHLHDASTQDIIIFCYRAKHTKIILLYKI